MSDDPPRPTSVSPAEEAKATAQAAAARRRWITLAEVLTVIAVSISALTLWNSWSERRDSEVTRTIEAQQASTRAATLVLTASSSGKGTLLLKPTADEQVVQSQTIAFPTALGIAPTQTTGEPRIEASWFESALKKARDKAGLADDSRGDERLPLAITTHFIVGGVAHDDVALYDLGYSIAGHWLSGHTVTLRGLSLVSRVKAGRAQGSLDTRWRRLVPQR